MALKVSKDGDNLNETKDYEVVDLNDQPQEEIQVETNVKEEKETETEETEKEESKQENKQEEGGQE